jgi:hypothetical protein
MVRKKFAKLYLASWGTAAGTYRRAPRRQMYSFAKKFWTIYFCKIDVKNVKKEKILRFG